MKVPNAKHLLGYKRNLPYFLVSDKIFLLKTWLMQPYPGTLSLAQKVFNYHLFQAWCTIENSFGILAARWRIFQHCQLWLSLVIKAKVDNAQKYAVAAIALHNYLHMTNNASYSPTIFIDSEKKGWRNSSQSLEESYYWWWWYRCFEKFTKYVTGSQYQKCAVIQSDNLQSYFMNTSANVWQVNHVISCGPIVTV